MAEAKLSVRNLFTTPTGFLALALLSVEFLGGMQSYLTTTITPLMAADLNGQHLYGAINGVPQVASFLTMPIGGALLARFSAARLLVQFTAVSAVGAIVSASAMHVELYLVGQAVSGLAAGALVTVSLGAIITGLPKEWRHIVLAGYSATWVVAALVGPAYAAWASELLSWRWALVLYLPLLVVARMVIARQLARAVSEPAPEGKKLNLVDSLVLATGIAMISLLTSLEPWRVGVAGLGVTVAIVALSRLLPSGVWTLRPGRQSTITLFAILTGVYFGAEAIVAIIAHDVLGLGAPEIGLVLTVGGLTWASVGLICGRFPASKDRIYRRRAGLGIALMSAGLAVMTGAVLPAFGSEAMLLLTLGWSVTGVGMGLIYLDTMNRIFDPPEQSDGITDSQAVTAVALAEAVPTAVFSTLTAAVVAASFEFGDSAAPGPAAVLAVSAVLALAMIPPLIRASRIAGRDAPATRRTAADTD